MSATIEDVLSGRARWCVVEGDCLAVLPTLPDKSVAHVITDPPYDQRTHDRARSLKNGGSDIPINFDPLADFAFLPHCLRVSERWVIAFCALEQLGGYQAAAGEGWVRAAIWHRTDGTPQISGDRPAQGAEGIAVMHTDAKKRWNGGGERGLWSYGVERTVEVRDGHPTPKPLPLMLRLLELFTDPGELVLDCFAGSGTTGVAALRTGRRVILVERDPVYAKVARERLEAESKGLTLRDARVGQRSLFEVGT